MSRIWLLLAAALSVACAPRARQERMAATNAQGQLVSIDSVTSSFEVGGLRVVHRENTANEIVAARLYLLGGTRQLTPATQGIEALLLEVGERGTATHPGANIRTAWARTGSQLSISNDYDWSVIGFVGVRSEFDRSFDLLADRVMNASLREEDVKIVRERLMGRLRQIRTSPDGELRLVSDSVAYAGHPYSLNALGTEASLARLDSAALARYRAEQLMTSRMLLVVVGNIDRPAIEQAVERTLARLPRGSYVWSLPERPKPPVQRVTLVKRPTATNYILGVFDGPPKSEGSSAAFRIAVALLGSRVAQKVRHEQGLSYAAYAPYNERGIVSGGLYVSTNYPNEVADEMTAQVRFIGQLTSEMTNMPYFTEQFVMDYLGENSTSAAQADFLARAQLYEGDYRKATEAMNQLRRVTTGAVAASARKYFRNMRFVYVGNPSKLDPEKLPTF